MDVAAWVLAVSLVLHVCPLLDRIKGWWVLEKAIDPLQHLGRGSIYTLKDHQAAVKHSTNQIRLNKFKRD